MDSLVNLFVGDLTLTTDLIFVARCLSVVMVVDVLTSLIGIVVPLAKSVR